MYQLLNLIKNFIKDEEGATAVEYGVLIALVIAACVVIIGTLGGRIDAAFNEVDSALVDQGVGTTTP
ncbi:MAG: Flp family type IVb pilin [Thermodesulfobacteriota bacterium]